jgi:hypothetical protein
MHKRDAVRLLRPHRGRPHCRAADKAEGLAAFIP